jgi:hypothetical protein
MEATNMAMRTHDEIAAMMEKVGKLCSGESDEIEAIYDTLVWALDNRIEDDRIENWLPL